MICAPGEITWHERRLARRIDARGEFGQVRALLGLKGVVISGRHRIESLYAVGGEGAVYLTRDLRNPAAPPQVAKVPLMPFHRPIDLREEVIRKQRRELRVEAWALRESRSPFLPQHEGLLEFRNPLLDPEWGDAFAEPEPVLLMEKLPGRDLDRWLARTHRSDVPRAQLRRTLDRVAVVVLQGLVDLYDRGYLYADLRPANLRMLGRPDRRVRFLDAGSLVSLDDRSGRFPHVPSYLPPGLFWAHRVGRPLIPSPQTQAIMAGRTLFEVATGRIPRPGDDVDLDLLGDSNVSPPVQAVVEGLCFGHFDHVRGALRYLVRHARRRVVGANDPRKVTQTLHPAPEPAPKRVVASHAEAAPKMTPAPTPAGQPVPNGRPTPRPVTTPRPIPMPRAPRRTLRDRLAWVLSSFRVSFFGSR